jgi:hypothetical protein
MAVSPVRAMIRRTVALLALTLVAAFGFITTSGPASAAPATAARIESARAAIAATLVAPAAVSTSAVSLNAEAVSDCFVANSYCRTGSIPANGSGHFVQILAGTNLGGGTFRVIDSGNGAVVWSKGLGNWQTKQYYIGGLYSSYYCEDRNSGFGATCQIFNF